MRTRVFLITILMTISTCAFSQNVIFVDDESFSMDASGATALMQAIQEDRPSEAVAKLIESGSDVNAHDTFGMTPLMLASGYNSHIEVIEMLLAAGADAYARDASFRTALMYAIENQRPQEIIDLLKRASSDSKTRY